MLQRIEELAWRSIYPTRVAPGGMCVDLRTSEIVNTPRWIVPAFLPESVSA